MAEQMRDAYPLRGRPRHYGWGGRHYLPDLLGIQVDDRPWAEYWLGAHSGDPAELWLDGHWRSLDALIRSAPQRWLGEATAQQYGELPYLLKVLDVSRPLSIQVHPNHAEAAAGFAQENSRGIALEDPRRNFKDPNPKPELALALSEFWLLHGFKPLTDIVRVLSGYPSLIDLVKRLENEGLKALFSHVMTAPKSQLAAWLLPVMEASTQQQSERQDPSYWIARWRALHETAEAAVDRGILGFMMMNLIHLKPGESIFQDANVPHAYLEGQCAEIMTNSDNVMRCGLTPKHVDVAAVIDHLNFTSSGTLQQQPPADLSAFALSHTTANDDVTIFGPACALVLDGSIHLPTMKAIRGQAFFVPGQRRVRPDMGTGARLLVGSPAEALLCS